MVEEEQIFDIADKSWRQCVTGLDGVWQVAETFCPNALRLRHNMEDPRPCHISHIMDLDDHIEGRVLQNIDFILPQTQHEGLATLSHFMDLKDQI